MNLLRLASTDDPISRVQAERVRALLEARPDTLACVELVFQECREPREAVGRLSKLVLEGKVDGAVCPAERLPGWLPHGVAVGAFLRDRSQRYECVSRGDPRLELLEPGACVVTTDPVAKAQINHRYPRLEVVIASPCGEILDALVGGAWDAACLPSELLEDGPLSGLNCAPVPDDEIVPAVGLGAVALLVKDGQVARHDLVAQLDDVDVRRFLLIEWTFLRLVPPDMDYIRTARTRWSLGLVEVTGLIAHAGGHWLVWDQAKASPGLAGIVAREIADSCMDLARLERSRAYTGRHEAAA